MANRNSTNIESTYNTIFADNTTQEISEADLRAYVEDMADSLMYANKTFTSLADDATTWNLGSYGRAAAVGTYTADATITLSNSVVSGVYYLYVNKGTANDVTLTFAESGLNVVHPGAQSGAGGSLTLKGDNLDDFLIKIVRIGGVIFVGTDSIPFTEYLLDEDDLSSDSATLAASQQSIKAYQDNLFDLQAVTLSTTTITLDFNSQRQRRFGTTAAHTANFSVVKSNDSNAVLGSYWFKTSGTVVVTLESDDYMSADQDGWDSVAKELTISTDATYQLVYEKDMDGNMQVVLNKGGS